MDSKARAKNRSRLPIFKTQLSKLVVLIRSVAHFLLQVIDLDSLLLQPQANLHSSQMAQLEQVLSATRAKVRSYIFAALPDPTILKAVPVMPLASSTSSFP